MSEQRPSRWPLLMLVLGIFLLGFLLRGYIPPGTIPFLDDPATTPPGTTTAPPTTTQPPVQPSSTGTPPVEQPYAEDGPSEGYLLQSPGIILTDLPPNDFGLGVNHVSQLEPMPDVKPGQIVPFDIWRYGGKGRTSFGAPTLPMPFEEWEKTLTAQKPKLMEQVRAYMAKRYNFHGGAIPGATMTRGKPIMAGPVARLHESVPDWEALGTLNSDDIRTRDLFPFKPLAHPLQTTGHMLFPEMWLRVHPEHRRMDVDLDLPDNYLPEYPPPLFLSTHKELGDVTNGREITLGNYFEIFNGLLTGEQLEGLKDLLRPTATTWFNHTHHRVTKAPSAGVACLSCHVNGHTNGAIAMGPDSRPNLARLRTDTPTLRGLFNVQTLSSKRAIRGLDHFAEVEEYFDGDPALGQAIGLRAVKDEVNNRMGDFQAIIDYSPAPKLGPDSRLIPHKATPAELRGEALFYGKAKCAQCHYGPAFTDDFLHDLQVERFYKGRPEGPIKTFSLRGIKDSPPYLHDGRLPTLHDTVEFFSLVLGLQLTRQEKDDLVAFLLCL